MFGDEFLGPWLAALREQVPGLAVFDAHTHIGYNDPDGYTCSPEQLLAGVEAVDGCSAVFPMHEPGGYPKANDWVIEEAGRSRGRLVPYCRLDPAREPLAEARRCLDAGARGIKLHPRAEGFQLDTPALEGVFELASDRGLPVLVHAGRGIPALGRHALAVCDRHPGLRLILAHAAICDLAWIWREAETRPNLFFDTAWWSAADLLALFSLVPPRHILFASDAPYGTPLFAATLHLRYALQAGLGEDALRLVFGGQMTRILDGEEPLDAGPALGPATLHTDPLLDRLAVFLVSAIGQMFNGVDPAETLALATLACEVGDDAPQAAVCSAVLAMLELRERHVAAQAHDGRPARMAPGLPMIVIAQALARTPAVPLPPLQAPATGVGDRAAGG